LRTFAALLTFFAIFIVVWLAVVLAWVAIVRATGFDDREGAIGFSIALYLAPLIAFAAAIACAMVVVTPRQSSPKP
jgi:predicted secreted protein